MNELNSTTTPRWTAWLRRHWRTDWERVATADSENEAHQLLRQHLGRVGAPRLLDTLVTGPGAAPPSGRASRVAKRQ